MVVARELLRCSGWFGKVVAKVSWVIKELLGGCYNVIDGC